MTARALIVVAALAVLCLGLAPAPAAESPPQGVLVAVVPWPTSEAWLLDPTRLDRPRPASAPVERSRLQGESLAAKASRTATPTSTAADSADARWMPFATRPASPLALRVRELPPLEVLADPLEHPLPTRLHLERILLGEVVEGWHWDAGQSVPGESGDLGTSVALEQWSFGVEGRIQRTTAKNDQGAYIEALLVGPSMRWRPSERTQVQFAPMMGVNAPYPMSEVFVAFGWKF